MMKRVLVPAALVAALAVAACNPRGVSSSEYEDSGSRVGGVGVVNGGQGMSFGGAKPADTATKAAPSASLGVNPYLWRAALDILSFMPLASADPFGGVIITSWYEPPAKPGERFKATAFILGRQLRADGLKVTIFRQVSKDGRWVDQAASPVMTSEIENRVLARARELRSDAAAN